MGQTAPAGGKVEPHFDYKTYKVQTQEERYAQSDVGDNLSGVVSGGGDGQMIDTKWHCSKPAENPMLKVGDVPDHNYALAQGTCDATGGKSGEKSGTWTEFQESWKTSLKFHGYFNVTMNDGDMVYYTYDQTGKPGEKKMLNKWKIASATGKHKGEKGSGTCTGMLNDDGSSDWECKGTAVKAGAEKKDM